MLEPNAQNRIDMDGLVPHQWLKDQMERVDIDLEESEESDVTNRS